MNPAPHLQELLRGLHERVEEVRELPQSAKRTLLIMAVVAALVVGTLVSMHGVARRVSEATPSYSHLERSLLSHLIRETAP